MTSVSAVLAIAAGAVLAVGACSSSASTTGSSTASSRSAAGAASSASSPGAPLTGTITVLAASSLTGTFTALGAAFEQAHPGVHVRFSFGASSTLATSIVNGAPADVFASAAPANMTTVANAGDATSPVVFARNTAEIAAAKGNPAHIAAVGDLARSGVKVALCQPTVPCGVLAGQVFTRAGITVKPTVLEPDVKSTLAQVELGEVDAGVVYVTDVKAAGSKVVGVPIPAPDNASTDYPIAVLIHSGTADVAQAFVAYVLSEAGEQTLTAAGFIHP